jgi:hypothetical protein
VWLCHHAVDPLPCSAADLRRTAALRRPHSRHRRRIRTCRSRWRWRCGALRCNCRCRTLPLLVLGAQAAFFGTYFGRSKWPGTKKTVEGTAAGFIGVMGSILVLQFAHSELAVLNHRSFQVRVAPPCRAAVHKLVQRVATQPAVRAPVCRSFNSLSLRQRRACWRPSRSRSTICSCPCTSSRLCCFCLHQWCDTVHNVAARCVMCPWDAGLHT